LAKKLKEFKLSEYTIAHNEDWIPENLDADDCKPYIIKIGPKTMDRLETYCKVYQAKVSIYNKSLTDADRKIKSKTAIAADCFEQIIHEALIQNVMQKLMSLDDKEFDKEFEEVNKPKSEQKEQVDKKTLRSGKK